MRHATLLAGWALAALLLAAGLTLYVELPKAVHAGVDAAFTMTGPRSATYPTFADSARHNVFLYKSSYFFNVTNAADVTAGRAHPILEQVGPYVYREFESRPEEYTQWHANGTVRFKQHTVYLFEPSLSKGTESDLITLPDLGMLGLLEKLKGGDSAVMDKVGQYLFSPGLTYFVARNVSQLLYGWEFLGLDMVAMQADDKNDISAKPFHAMYTGGEASATLAAAPARAYAKMTEWRGMTALPYWNSSFANMINGTNGAAFAPGVTRDRTEYSFVSTLTRSVALAFSRDIDDGGVPLYRLIMAPKVLQAASVNPANAAFYMAQEGMLISPASLGLPVVYTKPLYLDADRSSCSAVVRNAPWATEATREKYDTIIDVEPITGTVFRVNKRIQVNVHIGPLETAVDKRPWKIGADIRPSLVPIMWVDEHVNLSAHDRAAFKSKILFPLALANYLGITLMVIGCLLFVATPLLGHFCCRPAARGDLEESLPPYDPLRGTGVQDDATGL
jgi:hypothetical protein